MNLVPARKGGGVGRFVNRETLGYMVLAMPSPNFKVPARERRSRSIFMKAG